MVIDDAQSISELLCLVPLRFGCRRVIIAGDLNNPHNPFAENYSEKVLKAFNMLGRVSTLTNSVYNLQNIYRRDRPVMVSLWNLETDLEVATPEKELTIIKKVIEEAAVDLENSETAVVGLTWRYTDVWKHSGGEQTESFMVMNIDELLGIEVDVIILPLWSILSECDMNRMDIKKALDKIEFAKNRARQELIIIGEKGQLEKIANEKWKAVLSEAKEQSLKVTSIIAQSNK